MKDDTALEKRIVRIMATRARYDYPEPIPAWRNNYRIDMCPVCDKECLKRGGYAKHYTAMHAPDKSRQIAKRIIKAVRSNK